MEGSRPVRQRGFGLSEMMISTALGLLLIAAAVQVFLGSSAAYRYNQALAEVQGAARFAMHVLGHDLRLAGYSGCPASIDPLPSVADGPYASLRVISEQAVKRGITADNLLHDPLAAPDEQLPGSAAADSDALRLAYMRDYGVRIAGPANSLSANLKSSGNPGNWEAEDNLLVTDCRHADLFAVTGVGRSGGAVAIAHASDENTSNNLSKIYDENARVLEPYAVVYYVGDSDGGLYRKQYFAETAGTATYTELVPEVFDMSVRYGVDTGGDRAPDVYRAQKAVDDNDEWDDVVAARIGLGVESDTRVGDDAGREAFEILGKEVQPPDDGRLRRVFTTTVALRNRTP
jgi:type IV pilus assembly protein PilW